MGPDLQLVDYQSSVRSFCFLLELRQPLQLLIRPPFPVAQGTNNG